MSIFGDYKAYKKYEPAYDMWKYKRDIADAKRLEYLKKNPNEVNQEDIQKGKALLRAIDIMDEYSQKRAQNMEVATETTKLTILEIALIGGALLGVASSKLKFVSNLLKKITPKKLDPQLFRIATLSSLGMLAGTLVAIPMSAWAAKAQVTASRKGRFEAMRKDLNNINNFAIFTPEQIEEAKKRTPNMQIPEDEKNTANKKILAGLNTLKEMGTDSREYKAQKIQFEKELAESEKHLNDEMTQEEILEAKKEQQLLTKLVERIDIESQDYAENVELGVGALSTIFLVGGLLSEYIAGKLQKVFKIQDGKYFSAGKGVGLLLSIAGVAWASQAAKDASRVGRYKIKQELANNPEQLVYVDDEKAKGIKKIKLNSKKKNIFAFINEAIKNKKEYDKYKKTTAKDEKRFYKALETLDLSDKQIKDAQQLRKNTFKTFNKVDDKSQKYSESVEALGDCINNFIGTLIGCGLMFVTILSAGKAKGKVKKSQFETMLSEMPKYLIMIIPSILVNAYITKEQKKASRVADMLAINEMQDYRQFRG